MSDRPKRRRRCMLACPADSQKKIDKALASGVDLIFLDLEDGVAPVKKPEARDNCVNAFNNLDWGETVRCFRMNGIDSYWAVEDLISVVSRAGNNIDTIVIPKVKEAKDVQFVETLLELIEAENGIDHKIGFELLIEEVEGVLNIREISQASDRIESLMFGVGDYTRAQGVDIRDVMVKQARFYPGDIWHHQRSSLVVAARSAGIDYVDGPWGAIQDIEGFELECKKVKTLGGVGKWAIHPSQIPVATSVFTPDDQELVQAIMMKKMFEDAKAKGLGAIKTADGLLLDEAILPIVKNMFDKADFFGMDLTEHEKKADAAIAAGGKLNV